MSRDPIRGRTLRFDFIDGPMASASIEHTFGENGGVSWRIGGKSTHARTCLIAPIRRDVCAVSYLSESGYTLTVILDFETKMLTAFSSNEEELGLQHGTFEDVTAAEADYPPSSRATSKRFGQYHSLR